MARSDEPLALVIDLGTSSVRVGLWRPDGTTVRGAWREQRSQVTSERPGEATIEPAGLLRRLEAAVDEVVAAVPRLLPRVRVGAISCFLHSLAPLDRDGRPVGPIETWADTRAAAFARELRDDVDAEAAWQRTGCPIAGSFWPVKIRAGQARAAGVAWAGAPELVAEHLTGRRAIARNVASATGLLDRRTPSWDEPLLAALALQPAQLPSLVDDGEDLGALVPSLARRWPGLAHVRWIAPWGDAACSNVGVGAVSPKQAALNVGTSAALRALVPAPPDVLPRGLFAFRLFERTLVGGQLAEGGGVLDWMVRTVRRSRASLDADAARPEAANQGLTVLPYLAGERGLEYRDDATGAFAGLSLATDAPAMYRALAESVAIGIARVDERLSLALGAEPSVLAGGAGVAKSSFLAQTLADAVGRPITLARASEATSRGAALLALHGEAAISGDAAAVEAVRVVEPDLAATERLRAQRVRQDALAERLFA
jgi:gluconokinase